MNAPSSSGQLIAIRRLANPVSPGVFILMGWGVTAAAVISGFNSNYFYLSCLIAAYMAFLVVQKSFVTKTILFFVFCSLAFMPAAAERPSENRDFTRGEGRALAADKEYVFDFRLTNLEFHRRECGAMKGKVWSQGFDLGNLDLKAVGGRFLKIKIEPAYGTDLLSAVFEPDDIDRFTVVLAAKGDVPPRIFPGPEARGHDLYPLSVWVEFRNPTCRIIYHAKSVPRPRTAVK